MAQPNIAPTNTSGGNVSPASPAAANTHDTKLDSPQTTQGDPSIHITLYGYGGLAAPVLLSYVGLAAFLARSTTQAELRLVREDALISRSRCRATKYFLDSGKDVWVQLDHDIEFDPDDVIRLAATAHRTGAAVCIPYPCRTIPPRPALRPSVDHVQQLADLIDGKGKPGDTCPVLFCASGALAITRQAVIDTIALLSNDTVDQRLRIEWAKDPNVSEMPTLWQPFVHNGEYLSEDYAASIRMSACGIQQLAMQPKKPLLHWGEYNYTMPDDRVTGR